MFDILLLLLNICLTALILIMLGRAENPRPDGKRRLFDMPSRPPGGDRQSRKGS